MKRFIIVFILFCSSFAFMQDKYYTESQKKLLARRAAVIDGYRQLAESIRGVKINSTTLVKDFITEKDEISAKIDETIVKGAQVVAERYLEDGTYEVDMEVRLDSLVMFLENLQSQYNFDKYKNTNFNEIYNQYKGQTIKVRGTGAAPGGMSEIESSTILSKNEKLRIEVENLKNQLLQMQSLQLSYSKLQQENEQLKQQILVLNQQIAGTNQLVQSLRESMAKSQQDTLSLKAYKEQYESLVGQHRQLQDKLIHFQNMLSSYNDYKAKCEEYAKKYQETSQKLFFMQGQLEKLQEMQNLVTKYQAEIQKLTKEKDEMKNYLNYQTELQTKLSNSEKNNQYLLNENNRLLTQFQMLEKENKELKSKLNIIKDEVNKKPTTPSTDFTPSQKAKAKRAAILDGYRLLLECIEGVKIDSQTSVKDFVAESDQIRGAASGFIRGASEGSCRFLADGTCEIEMFINLDLLVKFLKQEARQLNSPKWDPEKFNGIYQQEKLGIIKVTGTGTFK